MDYRDFMHEADNAAPTNFWTAVDGDWDIDTRKLKAAHDGVTTIGTCYWTDSVTAQNEQLLYDIDLDIISTSANWWAALIIQADAQAGRYLGNSVVIYIDASDIKVYTSAANVLTERVTQTSAHSSGNNYHLEVDFTPSNGLITINQDTHDASDYPEAVTAIITGQTVAGSPYSGNTEIGLACENCEVDFGWFQIHRPDIDTIIDGSVNYGKYLNKRPGHYSFSYGADDDALLSSYEINAGDIIEILIENGTRLYREIYGRIENANKDTKRACTTISGRDILQQLVVNEADHTLGGATQQSGHITAIFTNNTDDLPTIDVKAAGDNYDVDYEGRSAWDSVMSVVEQLNEGMWADAWGRVYVTDSYGASGITIDNDDDVVLDAKNVNDLYDMCNTAHVYYNGGDELRTDATSQATYGKRGGPPPGGVKINYHIADAGAAQDLGDFLITNFKDLTNIVKVNVADYHELNPGQTCTLNLDNLNIQGTSALVMEKHFDDNYPFFTFVLVCYAGTEIPRAVRDPALTLDAGKHLGQDGQAWHL